MFDDNSRYANCPQLSLTQKDSDGVTQTILYAERRFLPSDDSPAMLEHRVITGERLDNITAQYLGDSTQFWMLCDTNQVMKPSELTSQVGNIIQIKLPGH